jgi:ketosteroid isomerase-like protein
MAFEVGSEEGYTTLGGNRADVSQRVTNIYRREGGEWKIVHHHSDFSPAVTDALNKARAMAAQTRT